MYKEQRGVYSFIIYGHVLCELLNDDWIGRCGSDATLLMLIDLEMFSAHRFQYCPCDEGISQHPDGNTEMVVFGVCLICVMLKGSSTP